MNIQKKKKHHGVNVSEMESVLIIFLANKLLQDAIENAQGNGLQQCLKNTSVILSSNTGTRFRKIDLGPLNKFQKILHHISGTPVNGLKSDFSVSKSKF